MKKVSVIIPVYNNEDTIADSIESIKNQTYHNWELIIVDDGSTDKSVEICLRYQEKDTRIRVIQCNHRGVSAARNKGVLESKCDLIAFNDADDVWKEDKLDKQIRKMDQGEYGLVYCRYAYVTTAIEKYIPSLDCDTKDLEGDIFESLWKVNKIGTPTILVKKQALNKVGMFCEELHSLEDWEFVMRVAGNFEIGFVDECLLIADYKKNTGVNSKWREQILTIVYIMKLYPEMDRLSKLEFIFLNMRRLNNVDYEKIYLMYNLKEYIKGYEERLIRNFNQQIYKENCNNKLYRILLNDQSLRKKMERYLTDCNAKIGIYGAGELGLVLAKVLREKGYNVYTFLDRNVYYVKGYECIHPDQNKEKVDLLINTVMGIDIKECNITGCKKKINITDFLKNS